MVSDIKASSELIQEEKFESQDLSLRHCQVR